MKYANERNHRGSEDDDVERRKQEQHEREHELHTEFSRALLGILAALGSRRVGVRAQRLGQAGAELVGLDQQRDQRLHVVHFRSRGKVLERLDAWLAGADFRRNQPQLIGERRVADAELVRCLDDRLVQPAACLDADNEEIECVREPFANLTLAQLDFPRQEHSRQEVTHRTREQHEEPSAADTDRGQGDESEQDGRDEIGQRVQDARLSDSCIRPSPAGGAGAPFPSGTWECRAGS